MTSLSTKFSKFSWGGMPPHPPTWAANAALAAFGGASAPHSKTTSFAYDGPHAGVCLHT